MSVAQFMRHRDEVRSVMERIAVQHGITLATVLGPERRREIVRARREIVRVLASEPFSLAANQIARHLGIHHSSVLNLLKHSDPRPITRDLMVPRITIGAGLIEDLEFRLAQIGRTRTALTEHFARLDVIEAEIRGTMARLASSNENGANRRTQWQQS